MSIRHSFYFHLLCIFIGTKTESRTLIDNVNAFLGYFVTITLHATFNQVHEKFMHSLFFENPMMTNANFDLIVTFLRNF